MYVAIYGGSFNPPHVAHVLAALYLLSVESFDRVLVVPVYRHAFDKPLAPFEHRLEMCRLAMAPLSRVEVSDVERTLPTPSLTLHTLRKLSADNPQWTMRLVVGADQLMEAEKWHAFDQINALAPPVVLGRVGVVHEGAPRALLPEVSSTEVRALIARRAEPAAADELRRLVPKAVLEYLTAHKVYG
jgi:nicotinate-nucleotide adenylyltransferase